MSRHLERRERARELRHNMTPAEAILWKHFRDRRFADFKFRRQHPIGPFYADLACHECKLIIEVDGETHLGQESSDQARTDYLDRHGWLVLRFWNTEVFDELESVLEAVYRVCCERKPTASPLTPSPSPPLRGRGEQADSPPHPQPLSPEAGARGEEGG